MITLCGSSAGDEGRVGRQDHGHDDRADRTRARRRGRRSAARRAAPPRPASRCAARRRAQARTRSSRSMGLSALRLPELTPFPIPAAPALSLPPYSTAVNAAASFLIYPRSVRAPRRHAYRTLAHARRRHAAHAADETGFFSVASASIFTVPDSSGYGDKRGRNKPFGPGGSTRRLHHMPVRAPTCTPSRRGHLMGAN